VTSRVSRYLHRVVTDTHQIAVNPIVGALAVPLALLVGLAVGFNRIGYDVLVTESLWVLGAMVGLGYVSTYLGAACLTGFIIGDWFSAEALRSTASFVDFRVPHLILYFTIAMAVVGSPLVVRTLLLTLPVPDNTPPTMVIPLAVTGSAILAYIFVDLWTAATPLAARTGFFWQGPSPNVNAIFPLQIEGFKLARGVAVIAMLRVLGVYWLESKFAAHPRVTAIETQAQPLVTRGAIDRLPVVVRVLGRVGLMLAVMASLYGSAGVVLLVAAPLVAVQLIRANIISLPIDPWKQLIERVPLIFRVIITVWLARQVIVRLVDRLDLDYPAFAIMVGGLSVVGLILLPGPSSERLASAQANVEDPDLYGRIDWLSASAPGAEGGASDLAPTGWLAHETPRTNMDAGPEPRRIHPGVGMSDLCVLRRRRLCR